MRRRSTYRVELTVTTAIGKTNTGSALVTVVPDTPPIAAFRVSPSPVIAANDATITPFASDPDAGDRIVEEDWNFTGTGAGQFGGKPPAGKYCDGNPGLGNAVASSCVSLLPPKVDLICIEFKGCAPPPGPLGPAGPISTAAAGLLRNAPVALFGGATPCTQCAVVPAAAFPPFSYNFLDQELARQGLDRLSSGRVQDALGALDSAGQVSLLRDLSHELERFTAASPNYQFRLPDRITMWAKDAEGAVSKTTQPVAVKGDQPPRAGIVFDSTDHGNLYSDNTDPKTGLPDGTGTRLNFDLSRVGDPDGSIGRYVLEAGKPAGSVLANGNPELGCPPPPIGPPYQKPPPPQKPGDIKLDGKTQDPQTPTQVVPYAGPLGPQNPPIDPVKPPLSLDQLKAGARLPVGFCDAQLRIVQPSEITPIVTTDPSALSFSFPHPSAPEQTFSAMLTVFDDIGLATRRRIDGFRIFHQLGGCGPLGVPQPFPLDSSPNGGLGLSGDAICAAPQKPGEGPVFYSRDVIDINGLRLKPAAGAAIVIDARVQNKLPLMYATPAQGMLDPKPNPDSSVSAPVDVQLERQPIARIANFDIYVGKYLFAGSVNAPKLKPPVLEAARYKGLPIAPDTVIVEPLGANFSSTVRLRQLLPSVFGSPGVRVNGEEATITDMNVAQVQRLTNHDAHDARVRRPVAHAAELGSPLMLAPNTSFGDGGSMLSAKDGGPGMMAFTYDAATGQWSGDALIRIPLIDYAIKIHLASPTTS